MSKEAALAFRNKVSENAALQAQVRQALEAGQGLDEAVRLGHEAGFEFSVVEAEQAMQQTNSEELSDFELAMVAGGAGKGNPTLKSVPSRVNLGSSLLSEHGAGVIGDHGSGFRGW